MATIINPILKGFNPDPSALRVGDDYYIATSTFQWWPGVQIHHSKDLVNWHTVAYPLDRVSQLNMRGEGNSFGIWAPCLSYKDGLFYLIYTDVKNFAGIYKDVHNYMVTAPDVTGPWSEPVYLNSTGFDPSIFFDDDGKAYILNVIWDFRKKENAFGKFAGILLREFSLTEKKLIGKPMNIFRGTEIGLVEGPNMYKKDGYYYLLCAEGGTGYNHAATLARAKDILGPYEVHPENPILTSAKDSSLLLQKSGHASFFTTQSGDWYMAHLCSRPVTEKKRSILGRETAIQAIEWGEDCWPRLKQGGNRPAVEVEVSGLEEHKFSTYPTVDHFDVDKLSLCYQSLRMPLSAEMCNLTERKGYLRLRGAESLSSFFSQSLIARRQQDYHYVAETCLEFEPTSYLQAAGLIALYDTQAYYYLKVTHDEELGKCISIAGNMNGEYLQPQEFNVSIEGWEKVYLSVEVNYGDLNFFYSKDAQNWTSIGPTYDATILSDEFGNGGHFTGAFVGLCAQDLGGTKQHADFDYFSYKEIR